MAQPEITKAVKALVYQVLRDMGFRHQTVHTTISVLCYADRFTESIEFQGMKLYYRDDIAAIEVWSAWPPDHAKYLGVHSYGHVLNTTLAVADPNFTTALHNALYDARSRRRPKHWKILLRYDDMSPCHRGQAITDIVWSDHRENFFKWYHWHRWYRWLFKMRPESYYWEHAIRRHYHPGVKLADCRLEDIRETVEILKSGLFSYYDIESQTEIIEKQK